MSILIYDDCPKYGQGEKSPGREDCADEKRLRCSQVPQFPEARFLQQLHGEGWRIIHLTRDDRVRRSLVTGDRQ